jgi:hypothetical protein
MRLCSVVVSADVSLRGGALGVLVALGVGVAPVVAVAPAGLAVGVLCAAAVLPPAPAPGLLTSTGETRRPAATLAPTVAIARGDASTRPCPIIDAAWSVSLVAVAGTLPKNAGAPSADGTPSPSDAAASCSALWLTCGACDMNAVLHEFAKAERSVIFPSALVG